MPTVTVTPRTYDRITDLARAWGISDEAAIIRLIDFWKQASSGGQDEADSIRVHVVYLGERVDGVYHPSTGWMDIISDPAHRATGSSPAQPPGKS